MKKYLLLFLFIILITAAFWFGKHNKAKTFTIQNSSSVEDSNFQEIANDPENKSAKEVIKQNVELPKSIPILMYHYIRNYTDPEDPIGINLSVSPETFEKQLEWLKDNSFQAVSMDFSNFSVPLDIKPIILTFDDGYQDAFDSAFPLLQEFGFSATFYLIVNKVGTPGYLTWDEIKEMQKAGMQFGSHTLSHPDLTKISPNQLNAEIVASKKIIEENLGQKIDTFCYPSGKFNQQVEDVIQNAGYQTATTTQSGQAQTDADLLVLKRFRITNQTSLSFLKN